nr:hypothetical protein [Tanacetum cinerariifolium]
MDLQDQGVIDSGFSRHMTKNMSYLTNYEEIDGGYVTFRGNPEGEKIRGKCTIKTGNLDFKNVYFVRELKFITKIGNLVDHKVKVIICDNVTKFKNKEMNQFCEMKGILRQFCVARTPQQNEVDERRNRTLIAVARTMLPDCKLPTTFWTKVVSTACYLHNRVLVVKLHNTTPYELFHSRTPAVSFMRPFGCPVTILNTIDHLGKFNGKADEGFFIGYSLNSKAFRVFNSRTRIVEENMHIRFSESTPNVVGSEPNWLFDIDALTRTINYEPIVAGTQSNGFACIKASDNADQAKKETESVKNYIFLPLWTSDPPFSQDPKSTHDDGSKPLSHDGKKVDEDPRKESESINSAGTNKVNDVGGKISIELLFDPKMHAFEDDSIFNFSSDDEDDGATADMNNLDTTIRVSLIPTTRIHKDHPLDQVNEDLQSATQTRKMSKNLEKHGFVSTFNKEQTIKTFKTACLLAFYHRKNPKSSTKKELCISFERLMHEKFQMSSMGELTFFLGLQVKKKKDGIFISQDKYVTEILKKFRFIEVKTASTSMETPKHVFKDKDGLWYLKDSPFDLVAYTDSDYAGASLDKKSTIGGNLVDHKVKVIICDNGTKFKNREMNQFCEMKGILRQFFVARTPQQNRVDERRNRTLIEVARTMLADSKLPTTFWTKVVSTACYLHNRVLVVKPHNTTLYELFHSRTPVVKFMRPFGCPVTIFNTIDHLGKFDGKADEGFFIGYSSNSKAFRVFNSRTKIVEENMHIRFSESTPNVVGSEPNWLFDIDALTRTINYEPIVADPKSTHDDGSKPLSDDGKSLAINAAGTNKVNDVDGKISIELPFDPKMHALEDDSIFNFSSDDEDDGATADMNNLDTTIRVSLITTTRIHKDHPLDQVNEDLQSATQTRKMSKNLEKHGFVSTFNKEQTIKTFKTAR